MKRSIFTLLVLSALLTIVGCSGGGNPVTPFDEKTPLAAGSIDTLPIIAPTMGSDGSFNAIGLMGAYELRVNPQNATAELVSLRLPSLGQSWLVSGIGFFTVAPCSNCLKLKSVGLTIEGYVKLTFTLKHPFALGNPSQPPSAVNRLDLNVFDVAMVLVPVGLTPTPYTLMSASAYTGILVNNAGYTKELAGLVGDTAAMPYALVVDDNLKGSKTFNKFSMGATVPFDVFVQATTLTTFEMYLTMGYGASAANKAQRLTPKYFNPEFNRKSAWKVTVTPPEGTDPPVMGNTWNNIDSTTPYNVTVKVYDWQQGVTTIANPPVNTGDIAFASNVASVSVEIPGMNTTLPSVTTKTSGTGAFNDPLVYDVPIMNQNLLDAGTYNGLAKVTDSRTPGVLPPTGTIDFLIDAPNGVTMTNYLIPEFATYQTFVATVVVGNTPPTCAFALGAPTINMGDTVLCTPGTMSDNTMIVSYEWDLDYDGITFNADVTQLSTDVGFGDPFQLGPWCDPTLSTVDYTIGLRVTDDNIPASDTICTQPLTVNGIWNPPSVDLIVATINRGEEGQNANLVTSADFTWAAVPCAAEYVIQRADVWDAPTTWNNFAISPTNSYKLLVGCDDPAVNTAAVQNQRSRFRIYARLVADDDTYVSPVSQEALLLFCTGWQNAGPYRMLERDREYVGAAGAPSIAAGAWSWTGSSADGCQTTAWPLEYSNQCYSNPMGTTTGWTQRNRWANHYCFVPDIANSTVSYVDCFVRTYNGYPSYADAGFTVGTGGETVPAIDTFVATWNEYNSANTPRGSLYTYETPNVNGMLTEYNDVNQAAFQNIALGAEWRHTSYFLDLQSATRDVFSVSYATGDFDATTIAGPPYAFVYGVVDAIAVVVY